MCWVKFSLYFQETDLSQRKHNKAKIAIHDVIKGSSLAARSSRLGGDGDNERALWESMPRAVALTYLPKCTHHRRTHSLGCVGRVGIISICISLYVLMISEAFQFGIKHSTHLWPKETSFHWVFAVFAVCWFPRLREKLPKTECLKRRIKEIYDGMLWCCPAEVEWKSEGRREEEWY